MNLSRSWYVAAIAATCMWLTACTTTTTQSFTRVQNSAVAASYRAVGADFSRYDRLTPADMGIFYPTQSAPSPEAQQRARDLFRDAFREQLLGYTIVENAKGPTTLLVEASLLDFTDATEADVMSLQRWLRDFARPGSIIFTMELKDSQSGAVLARAADSARITTLAPSDDVESPWDAVDLAAQRWARLFRVFLDENLGR
jgi:hypothetical protein